MIAAILMIVGVFAPLSNAYLTPSSYTTEKIGTLSWGPWNTDPCAGYDTASGSLIANTYNTLLEMGEPVTNQWGTWDVTEQYWAFSPGLATNVPNPVHVTAQFTGTINPTSPVGTVLEKVPPDTTKDYKLVWWIDDNPDGTLGFCDVVYIMEYAEGTTNPIVCRAYHVTAFAGTTLSVESFYYDFNLRELGIDGQPIKFWDSTGAAVDTFDLDDAVYTFQRALVYDFNGGPQWMYYLPMFNVMGSASLEGDATNAYMVAYLIKGAIEAASTSPPVLRLNLAFAFPDGAWKQIICNSWGSITSKEYLQSIKGWNGDLLADTNTNGYPDWWDRERVNGSQLITECEVIYNETSYCGTGPYHVSVFSADNNKVVLERNPGYWKTWPLSHKVQYLDVIDIDYVALWATRRLGFTSGIYDTIAVPRAYMGELLDAYNEPLMAEMKTCKNVAPTLLLDAFFFVFTVNPASAHIYTGTLPGGTPPLFFNNTHSRRAFAYAFNHSKHIAEAWRGEAICRETPAILGLLPDYYTKGPDPPYTYDIDMAKVVQELQNAYFVQDSVNKSVWDWNGFKMDVFYNTGNDPRKLGLENMKSTFDAINTLYGKSFQVNVLGISWGTYYPKRNNFEMPLFHIGWLADFADADNWYRPFMHSRGDYAYFQNYTVANGWGLNGPRSGWDKDVLMNIAVKTPDGATRASYYADLDDMYVSECVGVPSAQALGRMWGHYWRKGWSYNALVGNVMVEGVMGDRYKNITCWADVTGTPPPGQAWGIPDGAVNMRDVGYIANHYGAYAPDPSGPSQTPPRQIYDARWAPGIAGFGGADVYGDRKIDMRDIGFVCNHYGHVNIP